MNIPVICSAVLVKKRGTLQHNITDINADYIFHDIDQIEDLGKKSIQCGRRVDAVKLWFAWKYFGLKGYQKRIENLMEMATYAEEIVKNNSNLELLVNRQSFAVCFRYIPTITPAYIFAINNNTYKRNVLYKVNKCITSYSEEFAYYTKKYTSSKRPLYFSCLIY